jgi:uncharacterized protein
MRREQKQRILNDLRKKMVFIVGPRQVGKTWLSKEVAKSYKNPLYLNYDLLSDRKIMKAMSWVPETDLIIFDEIHKMPQWKNFLKGIYDTRNSDTHILVTGSARLETYRKAGDSLAGRFFVHHLLPLSLKELEGTAFEGNMERLLERGGFPEAFLAHAADDARRWRDGYIDSLIRDDITDFSDVDKMKAMKDVFEIVRHRVGSPLSYSNIAQDVGITSSTVKRYVEILEALYIVYLIRPHSEKISRSILKAPKVYFYDTGLVQGDEGVIFENMVGNALMKHKSFKKDTEGFQGELKYMRNKDEKEVDFVLTDRDSGVEMLIEVKLSDASLSKNLLYFAEKYTVSGLQLVKNIRHSIKPHPHIEIRDVKPFLTSLSA